MCHALERIVSVRTGNTEVIALGRPRGARWAKDGSTRAFTAQRRGEPCDPPSHPPRFGVDRWLLPTTSVTSSEGSPMTPRTSSTREILLTAFGLSLGMAIVLTASACTTSDAARSGASTTGGAVVGGAGAPHGGDGSTDAALEAWLAPPATPAVIAVPAGAVVRAHLRGV